ncbi:hypothetical protein [Mycobacterium colombiense]|uniref:hypothetical protein n=1 Tax=Mycobacterium colombiense TaxID=339268 RepID=UPI0010580151|nr:hypothetical protein [Mycobacterium colombiense]
MYFKQHQEKAKPQLGFGPSLEYSTALGSTPTLTVEWMGRRLTREGVPLNYKTIFRVANELLAEIKMFYGIISDEKEFVAPPCLLTRR